MFRPEMIVIHHSDTKDDGAVSWLAIRRYQMSYRVDRVIVSEEEWNRRKAANEGSFFETPWTDIGYHAGVEWVRFGDISSIEILMGRMWDVQGAHVLNYNEKALGFCFVGDFDEAAPSDELLTTGAKVIKLWMKLFGISKDEIFAHEELNYTSCPGRSFDMNRLKNLV